MGPKEVHSTVLTKEEEAAVAALELWAKVGDGVMR
jgi:hypothetical protein